MSARGAWGDGSPRRKRQTPEEQAQALEDYIKALVDKAPPLTDWQRDRLAVLLRPDVQP